MKNNKHEREEHFKRERRRTLDFEDEVFRSVESFTNEIKIKMTAISNVPTNLFESEKKNKILEDSTKYYVAELKNYRQRIDELFKKNIEI